MKKQKGEKMKNDSWAVIELMGHVTLAGKVTKPGEYGGLWQVDIPEGDSFHTEFFGSQSVYRIRMVSEEIARAYAKPGNQVIEYDAPIITRAEHQESMDRAREEYLKVFYENVRMRDKLIALNSLPAGIDEGE